jgi:hypothetical protein
MEFRFEILGRSIEECRDDQPIGAVISDQPGFIETNQTRRDGPRSDDQLAEFFAEAVEDAGFGFPHSRRGHAHLSGNHGR